MKKKMLRVFLKIRPHLKKRKIFPCGFYQRQQQQSAGEHGERKEGGGGWFSVELVCWLLAQRERVKIRLSGENTGDGCVLRLGTADGLTLLRLQRTQDWMCICAPKQWDWTPQSRRSLSRRQTDRREAKKRPGEHRLFCFSLVQFYGGFISAGSSEANTALR